MIEILPLLVMFIVFFSLLLGFFGIVHSGTLSSIAGRHYAFEVINQRTHLEVHRDYRGLQPSSDSEIYYPNLRAFAVVSFQEGEDTQPIVSNRGLNFFYDIDRKNEENPGKGLLEPSKNSFSAPRRSDQPGHRSHVSPRNPVWIMTTYGICIKADCLRQSR